MLRPVSPAMNENDRHIYLFIFDDAATFLHLFGGFGITGGAHRLWAHRSYKAKWPLRLFAAVAQTIAVQVS
jgi:fatty-acid desaturase